MAREYPYARRVLRWSAAAATCAVALTPGIAAAAKTPAPAWKQVASVSVPGFTHTDLDSVAATRGGAWALGVSWHGNSGTTSLWRWHGGKLNRIAIPAAYAGTTPGGASFAVAATRQDGWLFKGGTWLRSDGHLQETGTLPGDSSVNVEAAAGVPGTDQAWAFGSDVDKAYAARFDGTRWTASTLPQPGPGYTVYGASAVSANDVWAVADLNSVDTGNPQLLHWNGHRWGTVRLPSYLRNTSTWGNSVSARSASDVWVAGRTSAGPNGPETFVAHWNGRTWTAGALLTSDKAEGAGVEESAPDGKGGLWLVASGADTPELWHYANGIFTRARTSAAFHAEDLAQVPGTTSVWAAGSSGDNSTAQATGALLLNGKAPR